MKLKLITLAAFIGTVAFAGCTGCTKPIPLTLTSSSGTIWVGEEWIPATASLVVEKGVLSLAISGTVKERRADRLEWLRGSVPLGDLIAIDGAATQERSVKEDESGVLDVGFSSGTVVEPSLPNQEPVTEAESDLPPPQPLEEPSQPEKFVSPYSQVEPYFPGSYTLTVEAYDFFDLTINADGLATPISQTIRFTGRAGLLCVISPEESGHATSTSNPDQINEFEACAKLRPFLVP